MDGVQIAHRFEDFGWAIGLVRRKVMLCIEHPENNGRYATKYPDSRKEYMYYHDLYPEDYGIAKMWVVVRLNLIVKMMVIVLEMKYCRGPGRCMGVPNPRTRAVPRSTRARLKQLPMQYPVFYRAALRAG